MGYSMMRSKECTVPKLDDSFDDPNRRFVRMIQELEIKEALKMMKGGNTLGPDDVPIEVWRSLENVAIVWLTKLFNHIFAQTRCPKSEEKSILVTIDLHELRIYLKLY
jgi:hypothetical protein